MVIDQMVVFSGILLHGTETQKTIIWYTLTFINTVL